MDQNMISDNIICYKCNVPFEPKVVNFNYLGFKFNTDLPCCPVCGQTFITEELVNGRMREVEMALEDK